MHRFERLLLCVLLLPLACAPLAAQTALPAPPAIDSKTYVLMDGASGQVLSARLADERMEPASLTKMMTSYVVFAELQRGHVKLDDQVTVSERAWKMPGSRMFIEVNTQVSVEDLLHGLIIQSGNDASVALAEHVAGGERPFSDLMNQVAARLGMTASHFVNSSGLPDPDHYTTAYDMALLASALVRDFPEYYPMHAIREYVYNGITQHNRNRMLWRDSSVDGIKTGHTESAGYCLVVSAEREGMRLVASMLGAQSEAARTRDAEGLLNYGFRFFESHRLYGAAQPITEVRIWRGEHEALPVGVDKDLHVTVPRGQYPNLNAVMEVDTQIVAPVSVGEKRGTVRVMLGETLLGERPLVALQGVGEGGLWRRARDTVLMWFE